MWFRKTLDMSECEVEWNNKDVAGQNVEAEIIFDENM